MRKSFGFIGAMTLIVAAAWCESRTAKAERATRCGGNFADDTKGLVLARGNVEARATGHALRTESLSYDRDKQQFIVPGKLSLTEKNGETLSAANAIIDNALEQGRFNKLRLETASSGRMRAQAAERDGAILRLEDAIYTSCLECADPDDAPLWQIRASRITYDRTAQNVSYSHPRLEVYGLPVFYLPYMAHAGPEIDKRSGFLTPSLAGSNDFGTAVDMPYFFNLAPNYDLTLTPRFSDQQEPFITGEWRHLTGNGSYRLTGYIHRPQDELALIATKNCAAALSVTGSSRWRLVACFALQDATDDLFFRRYKISNAARLTSNLSAQRRFGNHFISLEAFHFRETLSAETASTVGAILPSLTHHYDFAEPIFGGALSVNNRLTHRRRDLDVDDKTVLHAQLVMAAYHARRFRAVSQ